MASRLSPLSTLWTRPEKTALPVKNGKHIDYALIGKNWLDYDYTIVLSHFKGHPMGGFGGALKIWLSECSRATARHGSIRLEKNQNADDWWNDGAAQNDFLETMAESSKAIMDHAGDRILYISVANNLSVDCDCVAHPEPVRMADIGIFASLDPVALDRACVDAVRNSTDHGKIHIWKNASPTATAARIFSTMPRALASAHKNMF